MQNPIKYAVVTIAILSTTLILAGLWAQTMIWLDNTLFTGAGVTVTITVIGAAIAFALVDTDRLNNKSNEP